MNKCTLSLFACLLLLACDKTPEKDQSLQSFKIEEGFKIELVASEPLISDPVDMEIDELGRWFVVEMHGYPLDLSGTGAIKRLVDTNDDGLPDQSTVFMDGLIFPTGILRWKQGFLVTDPPHVLYLEDADEDGRAEIIDTILTGFARSNPQHNVNNPTYGLDNWVYLSHEGAVKSQLFEEILGDQGEEVHFPASPEVDGLPQNANGLSVRFRPAPPEVEMLSARCQFGQTFDPWGHHFQTNNATHLFHAVIASHYMTRNQNLLIPSGQQYIPKNGRGFDIFPITVNPEHQLLTDIGAMTSACGIHWYQGGEFPEAYQNSVFTAEPVHNMIHVDVINDKGSTFESVELIKESEFLASSDSWFRPVNHYTGPDGAIYILDYHRKIIEHPEWLSDEVINSGDLYLGKDQGRIYRISVDGSGPMQFLDKINLAALNVDELIQMLEHKNNWWRTHAQRLLMDREDPAIVQKLEDFVLSTESTTGKVHGMWLIQSKNAMNESTILSLLNDQSAEVRENALKIAELHLLPNQNILKKLLEMTGDLSEKVRFQLLLTLGEIESTDAFEARMNLLFKDLEDPWVQYAALSAKNLDILEMYQRSAREFQERETPGRNTFFKKLSETLVRSVNSSELNKFLNDILQSPKLRWFDPLILEGIDKALTRDKKLTINNENLLLLVSKFKKSTAADLRSASLNVLHAVGYFEKKDQSLMAEAKAAIENDSSEPPLIIDAIRIIAWTNDYDHLELLKSIMANQPSPEVRLAVIDAIAEMKVPHGSDFLVSLWPDMLPAERLKAVGILLKDDGYRLALLDAIAENKIQPSSLSWSNTVSLLNCSNHEIRTQARNLLQGNELKANETWQQYEQALELTGNSSKGMTVFKNNCAVCHQIRGANGIAFGPDLSTMQNRNKASLLLDILQPNKSIADAFELWTLESISGVFYNGIISNQSPNTMTIKDATGKEETLDRREIKNLKVSEISAMPENLHMQINPQDMADLLSFLKNE